LVGDSIQTSLVFFDSAASSAPGVPRSICLITVPSGWNTLFRIR
jgi:hypothetical protein